MENSKTSDLPPYPGGAGGEMSDDFIAEEQLREDLASCEAEVAQLRAEVAKWKAEYDSLEAELLKRRGDVVELRSLIAAKDAALEPFAKRSDSYIPGSEPLFNDNYQIQVRLADCRKARAAREMS